MTKTAITLDNFIESLKSYSAPQVFNPWRDVDIEAELGTEGPAIRCANLYRYLELRQHAHYLFIAEALGYQGGHFTGLALTSERILLGKHPSVPPEKVLGILYPYCRTSNPASSRLNASQQKSGFNEPTDTVVWNALLEHGLSPFDVILWNIFPFHPYKGEDTLTNRTPSSQELELGWIYAQQLLQLLPELEIVAIGRNAARTLAAYGVDCHEVRHPSMGGAQQFKEQVAELFSIRLDK